VGCHAVGRKRTPPVGIGHAKPGQHGCEIRLQMLLPQDRDRVAADQRKRGVAAEPGEMRRANVFYCAHRRARRRVGGIGERLGQVVGLGEPAEGRGLAG